MTYPQQQYAQPAPQGYAPPQYQQPYPQQQQYAPPAPVAPQGWPGQQQPQTNPAAGLADPTAPPAAGQAPRIQDLGVGRLVLIYPKDIEKVASNFKGDPPGTMKDRMTADLVVLDGPPFAYGGSEIAGRPHDKQCEAPARFNRMWIGQVALISACRDVLTEVKAGKPGMVLGRLDKGQPSGGQPPWILRKATEEDRAIAIAYLNSCAVNGTPPNKITPLQATPGGVQPGWQPQVPSYVDPGVAQAMQQAAYQAQAPQYVPAGPPQQQPVQQQAAAYLANPDPGAQYAPQQPAQQPAAPPDFAAYQAWLASQQQSAPPAPQAPAPHPGWAAGV